MKKLLSVVLALVMTMALMVPAFAAADEAPVDGDPGFFTQNWMPVPTYKQGDPVPINLEPDGFEFVPEAINNIGIIGGADGPTAIFTTGLMGDGALDDILNGNFEWWTADDAQALLDAQKEALGGVPGQIGVLVNGEYIKFADAAPEVKDGCTMAPIRALVESLGGEVNFDDGKIMCKTDNAIIALNIGSNKATVDHPAAENSDEVINEDIKMDCAPYISNGRTYVPVRVVGEALGYEVGWDSACQTVILLDRDSMAAEIDEQFAIMNRVLSASALSLKDGKNYSTETKGNVTATIFDTLNGNKTYKADLTGKTLLNSKAVSGTCSLTLSDSLVDLLLQLFELDGPDAEIVRAALKNLKDMQAIMTEQGAIWAHAPALDEISGKENVWCGMDMGAELGKALFSSADTTTMGTAIAALMNPNSVGEYIAATQAAKFMTALYGDKNFTTDGGTSTLTIGVEELLDVCEILTGASVSADDVKDVFKEYKITMKVGSKGTASVACTMETADKSGMPGIKLTMDATRSDGKANLTMNLHIANIGQLELTLDTAQQAVSEKPMAEPPAGATIISDSPSLLNP